MQATDSLVHVFIYVLFFGFSWMCKINGIHRLISDDGVFTSKPLGLIGSHLIGMIWLGIVPVILVKTSILSVLTEIEIRNGFLIVLYVLIFMIITTIALNQSKKEFENKQGSIENVGHLSSRFFIFYFIIRALFLFSYELWFRGFLLFDCIRWFGIPLAVFMNGILYVLIHIFNSKKEALACIPFGLLVCFFSLTFNSAWLAILLHIGFSLVYELNFYRLHLINPKTVKS
jgi:membrane protease YdiL (CAAX protease family)